MGYYWVWDEDTEEYKKASEFYCTLLGYANIPQAEAESFEQSQVFTLPQNNFHDEPNYYLTTSYVANFKAIAQYANSHLHKDGQPLPFAITPAKIALPKRDYETNSPFTRHAATDDNYLPFTKKVFLANKTQITNTKYPWYEKNNTKLFYVSEKAIEQCVILLYYDSTDNTIKYMTSGDGGSKPYFTASDHEASLNLKSSEDIITKINSGDLSVTSSGLADISNNPKSYSSLFSTLLGGDYAKSYIYIALQGPGGGGGCGSLGSLVLGTGGNGGGGGGGGAFMTLAINLSATPDTLYLLYPGCGGCPEKPTSRPGWEARGGWARTSCGSFLAKKTSRGVFQIIAYADAGHGGQNHSNPFDGDRRAKGGDGGKTAYFNLQNMTIIDKITGGTGGEGGTSGGYCWFVPLGDKHGTAGNDASNELFWSPVYCTSYTINKTVNIKNAANETLTMTIGGTESLSGTPRYTSAGGGGGGAVCAGRYTKADESTRTQGRDFRGYGAGGYGSATEAAEVHNGGWGLPGFVAIIDVY